MNIRKILHAVILLLCCGAVIGQDLPMPTPLQVEWQEMETTAFLHFSINTFTDKEWGDGSEDPALFNPTRFDARQWVKALKDAGFKMAILTAKHHDGFCLWPTKTTDHSVKKSPWKNGNGDVVREVAEACKEFGIKFGFYLSPWDRHEKSYGTPAYNDFYKAQLRELLTNYGPVAEVWFDGAKGQHEKDMVYDFEGYWKLVRELQPNAIIYSGVGPDVRWVGNEKGNSGETCWSTITPDGMMPGKVNPAYLNTGDAAGKKWMPAETDVSIRKGWFWHAGEDSTVRTPENLLDLYYQSVGRNSLLLLNIPPNRDGLLDERDIRSISGFHTLLSATFAKNLLDQPRRSKLTDGRLDSYDSLREGEPRVFSLKGDKTIDLIVMQENIRHGQHIQEGKWDYWNGAAWMLLKSFTTVGYKRILRVPAVHMSLLRLTIGKSKQNKVELSELGFYKALGKN
jgi:alpha-L-fucosidase